MYLKTILLYVLSTTDAGDINDGYEHVLDRMGRNNGDGNNYDNIYDGDINEGCDDESHQRGRKDGNETDSRNSYDKIDTIDKHHDYDNVIHQTGRNDGEGTGSGNNSENAATQDYDSLDDARPPSSIFPDVCEEIDNQK